MLESYELVGANDGAKLGVFLGTGGFQAVRLASGVKVDLRGVTIKTRIPGESPTSITFDVIVARGIVVDGKPAESWFGNDPMLHTSGERRCGESSTSHQFRDDYSETAATIDEEKRFHVSTPYPPQSADKGQ